MNIRLPIDYKEEDIKLLESAYHDKHYNIAIVIKDVYYANKEIEYILRIYIFI